MRVRQQPSHHLVRIWSAVRWLTTTGSSGSKPKSKTGVRWHKLPWHHPALEERHSLPRMPALRESLRDNTTDNHTRH